MITNTAYSPDIREVINLFLPESQVEVAHAFTESEGNYHNTVTVNGVNYEFTDIKPHAETPLEKKRFEKRNIKLCVYKALESYFNKSMPWGALTGIRPTKLAYTEEENSRDFKELFKKMRVSEEKTALTGKILAAQKGIYEKDTDNTDFFVFIPFCATKCRYCSFITADISKSGRYISDYITALCEEIKEAKKLIKNLRSVYIGGGTPVSLPAEELRRVLEAVGRQNAEYTVEAGRPDCMDEENIKLLKEYGVTRICVNPQTFNDATLERLGRRHTAADVVEKYNLVKGDFVVNMDLIAGLEGETIKDFKNSVDTAINLRPDNITVHTLCLKKGSELKESVGYLSENGVSEMVEYAHKALAAAGYIPYYLYRQKYMAGNLENTGYALPGKQCVYNIDVMEEISGNVACGANAVSKAVFDGCAKIERYRNPKDILTYIEKLQTVISEKKKLFEGGGL